MRVTSFPFGDGPASSGASTPQAGHARASGRDISVLESRYPGVVQTVTLLWGHPELSDFLARVAAGLEPRLAHIDPAALAELMLLGEIHRFICPRHERTVAPAAAVGRLGGGWRPAIHRG